MPLRARIAGLWRNLVHRAAVDDDLDEELQAYVGLLAEEKIRAGKAAADAWRAAQIELGGLEQVKERVRDVRSGEFVTKLAMDVRFALRMLRRTPVVSAAIVVTLGLAIGANAAIFSLVNALVLTPMPVAHPERLVFVHRVPPDGSDDDGFSNAAFELLRGSTGGLADIGASDFTRLNVGVAGQAEPAEGMLVSGNLFTVLGLNPALGRLLDPSDDVPGRPPVAVISDRYWRKRFGQARSIVGSTIDLNGAPATVVGVLPRAFTGLTIGTSEGDVWVPLAMRPSFGLKDHTEVSLLARVAPNGSTAAVKDKLTQVYRSLVADSVGATATPSAQKAVETARVSLVSAARGKGSGLGSQLRILMFVGLLVLLVVCANLANLLLARAIARRREIALRLALGASRARLVQQLLTEGLVLATLGGGLGLLIASWGGETLARSMASDVNAIAVTLTLDLRVLLFVAGVTTLATIVFTLVPVVSFARTDLQSVLKAGAPGARGSRLALRLGRALVVLQVALSLVLLVTAGVLVRSVRNLAALDPGFDRNHVLLFAVYPAALGYEGSRELRLYQQLRERLEAVPGVLSASSSRVRLASSGREGCEAAKDGAPSTVGFGSPVSSRFFSTMGVALLAGREFDDDDRAGASPVAIVSREASRVFFPDGQAIGKRISIGGEPAGRTVVGVVGDVGTYSRDLDDRGLPSCNVYIPVPQASATLMGQQWIEIRTAGDPAALLPAARLAVREVDRNLSLYWPSTLAEQVRDLYGDQTSLATLSGVFGGLALAFAAIGLLGIVSYAVASRTSEIGLRLALGARPGAILTGIVGETMGLVLGGAVVGVVVALGAVRVTSGLLYGVSALDPVSLVGAAATLVVVGLAAAYAPARRASRLDPAVTLRRE